MEGTTVSKSDTDLLEAWISKLKNREKARLSNASPSYYEEFKKLLDGKKLDTTVKKCTALVRKFKGYTKSMLNPIQKEIRYVNLTKYLSEVADVIAESKFKMADIPDIITVCTMLHERYPEFRKLLGDGFAKILRGAELPAKVKVPLCLCGELIVTGILNQNQGFTTIYACFRKLISSDPDGVQCVATCLQFCGSVGEEFFGLVPKQIRNCAAQENKVVPRSNIFSSEQVELMRSELENHYSGLIKTLTKLHKRTLESEKQNRRLLKYRGAIPQDRSDEHTKINQEFENLRITAEKLCNEMDNELPSFPALASDFDEDEKLIGLVRSDENSTTTDSGLVLYGDEETRSFYQDFPNLMVYLPPVAYKDCVLEAAAEKEKVAQREKAMQYFDMEIESAKLKYEDDTYGSDQDDDFRDETPIFADTKPASAPFTLFLRGLRECVNKDMIDAAAYEFVNSHNTKNNCKLLTETLLDLPIRRNDLIPLWSRFVAILSPVFPVISLELCKRLHSDLRRLVRKKNQFHLEIKLKTTRYIGELVKFGVFPKSDVFNCLRILVASFVHHQIDMACALVEACGKYLYLNYDSHQRMKLYLDTIMRKKNAKILESRYVCLIDNAYYSVCPPEHVPHVAVVKPMIQLYMEYLLQELTNNNLEETINEFRRLDWSDPEVRSCAIKCLSQPENATNAQVQYYASLIAGLTEQQRYLSTYIVDNVLNTMDDGLELDLGSQQLRLANITFVGELYSYRLLKRDTIFTILYKIIQHKVSFDPANPSHLDPPNSFFRLRLCCALLKTCAVFFYGQKSAERLRCFIAYLQCYYWMKRSMTPVLNSTSLCALPYSINEIYEETVTGIRGTQLCTSLFEAVERCSTLQKELAEIHYEEIENYRKENANATHMRTTGQHESSNSELCTIEEDAEWPSLNGQSQSSRILKPLEENKLNINHDTKTAEDLANEEFDREYDRLCAESLTGAQNPVSAEFRRGILEIPLPARNKRPVLDSDSSSTGPTFYLLCKKQNKQKDQLTPISIPADSDLFTKLREREVADQIEQAEVKRLTLQMNELRIAEEEAVEEAKKQAAIAALLKVPKYKDTNRRTRRFYQ